MPNNYYEMRRIAASARATAIMATRAGGGSSADIGYHEKNGRYLITFPRGHIMVMVERSLGLFGAGNIIMRLSAAPTAEQHLTARFELGRPGSVMLVESAPRLRENDALLNPDGTFGAWVDLSGRVGDIVVRQAGQHTHVVSQQAFSPLIHALLGPQP